MLKEATSCDRRSRRIRPTSVRVLACPSDGSAVGRRVAKNEKKAEEEERRENGVHGMREAQFMKSTDGCKAHLEVQLVSVKSLVEGTHTGALDSTRHRRPVQSSKSSRCICQENRKFSLLLAFGVTPASREVKDGQRAKIAHPLTVGMTEKMVQRALLVPPTNRVRAVMLCLQ